MTRKERAMENFKAGYNCAQSVALAFIDKTNLDESTLLKISSGFGGGMGRLREVCGAVSGMFMVAGLVLGYDDPGAKGEKARLYGDIQNLANEFKAKNGSIVCRELLGVAGAQPPVPEARSGEYYKKRPCAELVGDAAEILDAYLAEKGL